MQRPLLLAAALLCALLAPTSAQVPPSDQLVAKNETGCGEKGAVCCQLQLSPQSMQVVCNRQGLYCSPDERCLEVPSDCGQQGAACCPGNASVAYCRAAGTVCLPTNTTAAADNQEGANTPICRRFELSTCGQAGGLCSGAPGGWLPPPAPQCPADQRGCPEGYYCWRSSADTLGVCILLPPNCGAEGARCCPPGLYGGASPKNVTAPYCTRDAAHPNIYCTGSDGAPGAGVCERWPQYPSECGTPGKPCCRNTYHQWMDAAPSWPQCQNGSYCEADASNEIGTCIENAKDCGLEGRGCCKTTTPATTNYWCQAGLYCPFGEAQDQPCQRCPPPAAAEEQGLYECQQQALDSKAAGTWAGP